MAILTKAELDGITVGRVSHITDTQRFELEGRMVRTIDMLAKHLDWALKNIYGPDDTRDGENICSYCLQECSPVYFDSGEHDTKCPYAAALRDLKIVRGE